MGVPRVTARANAATPASESQQTKTSAAPRSDGRRARWVAHRAARREELIDAAIAAICEHGAGAGMDRIAHAAGTSKPVIYRYFSDKTELYRAVSKRAVGTLLITLEEVAAKHPSPQELMRASVDAYLLLLESQPELFRFVARNPELTCSASRDGTDFSTVVAELLSRELAAHLGQAGLSPTLAHPWGEGMVGFIRAATVWWLDNRDAMTRQQLCDYLTALLWGGAAGLRQLPVPPAVR